MNCARCFHSDHAHGGGGDSLTRRGECCIPGCGCAGFKDMIYAIDEELT